MVLDSLGVGELPDAKIYGDVGSHTLNNVYKACGGIKVPQLQKLGLGNISGVNIGGNIESPIGAYGKVMEESMGKDTVTGHWEIAGVVLREPMNTYPNGFSKEIINNFLAKVKKEGVIANCVASGTEIIERFGDEHVKTGYPIIYTSADSVFQIAAHEDVIPLDELYRMCEIAREMLVGEDLVGRVIARPFLGESGNYYRTSNRHDYSLDPFSKTMLEYLKDDGKEVAGVGKISDIFNGKGITSSVNIKNNMDGVNKTLECMDKVKSGLIFTNLVDFDMLFGHRNDPIGYGNALEEFDNRLEEIYSKMTDEDILIITADHGCDPTTESTDHSREHIPVLVYGNKIKSVEIKTKNSFTDIGKTVLEYLDVENDLLGKNFINEVLK
ncbi:MAG: phosphopentomutase [Clostridium sp.]